MNTKSEQQLKEVRKAAMAVDTGVIISVILLGHLCEKEFAEDVFDVCRERLIEQGLAEMEVNEFLYGIKSITELVREERETQGEKTL